MANDFDPLLSEEKIYSSYPYSISDDSSLHDNTKSHERRGYPRLSQVQQAVTLAILFFLLFTNMILVYKVVGSPMTVLSIGKINGLLNMLWDHHTKETSTRP